ncbi:MAG TPA: FAD/NAD(P)-binding oxidoreductase, partial [Pseudorhodoferax sp.]|nr:FAD/NAD(P)-binding oxidoreductase [Pseudorhodoferax sp.]
MQRRSFLHSSAGLALLGLGACASTTGIPSKAKVVVIGGGYGGATTAKYVRLLSDYKIDVVLVEPNAAFVSCPISNLVVGGSRQIADVTSPYTELTRRHGVTLVQDTATAIDTAARTVRLAGGRTIGYDKLVVSPGVDLQFGSIE